MSTLSDVRGRPLYLQNDGLDFLRVKAFIEDIDIQEPLIQAAVPLPVIGDLGQVKLDAAILDQLGSANAQLSDTLNRLYIQWESDLEIVYLKELIAFAPNLDPYLPAVLTTNPIAAFMERETSGTTIIDASVNVNNGVYVGATLGQDAPPTGFTAVLYDGVNDFGNIYSAGLAGLVDFDEGCALVWFKVLNVGVWTDGTVRQALKVQRDANNNFLVTKRSQDNQVRLEIKAGANSEIFDITASPTGWNSYMISWSLSGDLIEYYKNTTLVGTDSGLVAATGAGLNANNTGIGAANTVSTQEFTGFIGPVILWDTPATAAIIALGAV